MVWWTMVRRSCKEDGMKNSMESLNGKTNKVGMEGYELLLICSVSVCWHTDIHF